MSSITIATLPHISRDTLAALLSTSAPDKLAIIDVRDSGKYFTANTKSNYAYDLTQITLGATSTPPPGLRAPRSMSVWQSSCAHSKMLKKWSSTVH